MLTKCALIFLFSSINGQSTPSIERISVAVNTEYNFNWRYSGLHVHTWHFSTQKEAELTLTCPVVQMKKFTGRCRDYLNVTVTGNLRDGKLFCDPFEIKGSSVIMKLFSLDGQGYLKCKIKSEMKSGCKCGYTPSDGALKVTGGIPAGVHEFTSYAGLIDRVCHEVRCGATLINNRLALTAAHCVVDGTSLAPLETDSYALLVGDYDLSRPNDSSSSKTYRIRRFVPHPKFNFANISSDIAFIETSELMGFSPDVGPACLPYKFSDPLYLKEAAIAGWGHTEFGGTGSDVLLKATVVIEYPRFCQEYEAYAAAFSAENMICTYGFGADSCQHDSGGPLYYRDPATSFLFLIGVTSKGIGCGGEYPSVSTRVYSYLEWIHETYPDERFCVQS